MNLRNERNDQPSSSRSNTHTLSRKKHIESLIKGLTKELPQHFDKCVPGQTWLVFWITHSLTLLEQQQVVVSAKDDIIEFMRECSHPEGGYGGGPGQIAHLATTYAAVNALITTSSIEALESIERQSLVKFMHRMKQPDGSFSMHDDGEIDSRATYCALAVLKCLNIQDSMLLQNVAEWLLDCQTYEGGFGSVPGSEAHGGYTFCCVASLCLLNQLHRLNMPALLRWLTNKQLTYHGGFCGRSNKLVDSCYSYWQGAVFPLIHPFLTQTQMKHKSKIDKSTSDGHPPASSERLSSLRSSSQAGLKIKKNDIFKPTIGDDICDMWLFSCEALQNYILGSCQSREGLLKDKPGTSADFYHTCYALSGLSISQYQPGGSIFDLGNQQMNLLAPTSPVFNLSLDNLNFCFDYYRCKKIELLPASNDDDLI